MKMLLLFSIFLAVNAYGVDFTKQQDGISGRFISDSTSMNFKPDEKRGILQQVIWNVVFSKSDTPPQVFICSGQVRHFNVGTPLEGIPIFLGGEANLPQLGALTDSKGKFSFSVMFDAKSKRSDRICIDSQISSIYLYVGGAIQTIYQSKSDCIFPSKMPDRFSLVKGS